MLIMLACPSSLLRRLRIPTVLRPLCALLFLSVLSSTVHAAGVVTVPTEAALAVAMQGGGLVTFACDGVIPITITKKVGPGTGGDGTSTLTLDATGHNITLDGGGSVQILSVFTSGSLAGSPPPYSLTIKHLTLANGSTSAHGGAVYADVNTTLTLSDCTFLNNRVTAGSGGAICVQPNGIVTITNSLFLNNTASGSGGALLVNSLGGVFNTVNVTNTIFAGNTINAPNAPQYGGQGNVLGGAASVNCIDYAGNGLNLCAFTNCAFLDNQITAGTNTDVRGGALTVSTSNATIVNCTFAGNRAVTSSGGNAYGGALYCNGASSQRYFITNCTVANNAVIGGMGGAGQGGGIFDNNGDPSSSYVPTLINTIIANNTANTSGNNGAGAFADGGHNICADASFDFTVASLNNTDPRLGPFVYTAGGVPTLSLLPNSPAIDAGDDTQAPTTDARGAARQGAHSDIGAYERPLWQAQSLSVGSDGNTHVLWCKNDGTIQLWNVNTTTGSVLTRNSYGPFADWTATSVSVGADNKTRVLWINAAGQIGLWSIDETNGSAVYTSAYGPCTPWNAQCIAVGSDNLARVLWTTPAGYMSLWNVDVAANASTYGAAYGPCAPWSAQSMALDSDNHASILWTAPGGLMSPWRLDSLSAIPHYSPAYPTDASWTATALSVGGDKRARVLWNRVDGTTGVWSVDTSTGAVDGGVAYVPPVGAAYTALSAGSDNNTRLLASQLDGTLLLSVVDTHTGSVLAAYTFPAP